MYSMKATAVTCYGVSTCYMELNKTVIADINISEKILDYHSCEKAIQKNPHAQLE